MKQRLEIKQGFWNAVHNCVRSTFFALCVCIIATSCTKDPEGTPQDPNSNVVEFKAYSFENDVTEPNTRGAIKNDFVNGDKFGVFGSYLKSGVWLEESPLDFMYNQAITKSGADPVTWTYSPKKYWPNNTSYKVKFFAYAPREEAVNTKGLTFSGNAALGTPTVTYDMPSSAVDQPDLMIAEPLLKSKSEGKITFAFEHALAAVGVAIKANSYGTVTSISIKNIVDKGTRKMDNTSEWTDITASAATYNIGLNTSSPATAEKPVTATDGYLMVIPQTMGTEAEIIITIGTETRTVKFSTTSSKEWIAGKKYTYNITVSDSFVCTITDWDDVSIGGNINDNNSVVKLTANNLILDLATMSETVPAELTLPYESNQPVDVYFPTDDTYSEWTLANSTLSAYKPSGCTLISLSPSDDKKSGTINFTFTKADIKVALPYQIKLKSGSASQIVKVIGSLPIEESVSGEGGTIEIDLSKVINLNNISWDISGVTVTQTAAGSTSYKFEVPANFTTTWTLTTIGDVSNTTALSNEDEPDAVPTFGEAGVQREFVGNIDGVTVTITQAAGTGSATYRYYGRYGSAVSPIETTGKNAGYTRRRAVVDISAAKETTWGPAGFINVIDPWNGRANTKAIVALVFDPIITYPSATYCNEMAPAGEWYLPAINQAVGTKIAFEGFYINIDGTFSSGRFLFTSTDNNESQLSVLVWVDGSVTSSSKHYNGTVRCIRDL